MAGAIKATESASSMGVSNTADTKTAVGQVAELYFVKPLFAPPSPLIGKRMPFQDAYPSLGKKILDAYALICDGQNDRARALFREIQTELEEERRAQGEFKDVKSILPASCILGLAYTYPDNRDEGIRLKDEAKKEIDKLYENRASWDALGVREKKIVYTTLLAEYRNLLAWTSSENLRAEINLKVEECEKTMISLILSSKQDQRPKEVTKSSTCKVYAFAIAALTPIVGAVVFYNRLFIKE